MCANYLYKTHHSKICDKGYFLREGRVRQVTLFKAHLSENDENALKTLIRDLIEASIAALL